ncbi:MAG: TolC family protein, partial [Thiobacillus sp.]|nr:TolC family protein [Thiobacillus sp.]
MNAPQFTCMLTLLAGLGLAGCATVGPDYTQPAQDGPAAWNRLDASTPIARADAPGDLSQWWQGLNDPLLSDLVNEALQASPDLRTAQARLREARARRTVAAAARFPSVTASGSARRSQSSEETGSGDARNAFSAGFDASWEIDVFGGVRRSVEAAEADLESSVANLDNTRVSLASEVALNYVEVRALQTRLGIARANLASQSETLQLTDWRAQAGLVSSQDVEQARSN